MKISALNPSKIFLYRKFKLLYKDLLEGVQIVLFVKIRPNIPIFLGLSDKNVTYNGKIMENLSRYLQKHTLSSIKCNI